VASSLGAAFYLLAYMPFALATEKELSLEVTCEAQKCLVSVSAQPAPLREILRELAARTGLEIGIDPSVSYDVMQHFERLPLDIAIQRLAGPYGTLLIYDDGNDAQRLRKVHVMARNQATLGQAARAGSDLPPLDDYGRAWLAAHYDSAPRFLPAASIEAAIGWQNYLARLTSAQRSSLHERILQSRARRVAARQLAAGTLLSGTAVP